MPRGAARSALGLAAIALSTLAMGATESFAAWMVLRFAARIRQRLGAGLRVGLVARAAGKAGRPDLGGAVYAGVGAGIVFAGRHSAWS